MRRPWRCIGPGLLRLWHLLNDSVGRRNALAIQVYDLTLTEMPPLLEECIRPSHCGRNLEVS